MEIEEMKKWIEKESTQSSITVWMNASKVLAESSKLLQVAQYEASLYDNEGNMLSAKKRLEDAEEIYEKALLSFEEAKNGFIATKPKT